MSSQFEMDYTFNNQDLLVQAMTHKSYANEGGQDVPVHNEKLEFLGDAVLDLVLSEYLMEIFPADSEGNLSKKRASLVNETVLSQIAQNLKLSDFMRLGKGEVLSMGHQKPRLLASAYEALLGAVFIDGGYEQAKRLARTHFQSVLQEMDPTQDFYSDFKTRLQESAQSDLRMSPSYEVTGEQGPSHNPQFEVTLKLHESVVSKGWGRSKKMAEQQAAKQALEVWSQILEQMKVGNKNV